MGKSTISMVIFNSYVKLPEGIPQFPGNMPIFLSPKDRLWHLHFLIARQDRVVPPQIPAAPQDYQVLLRDGDIPQLWPFISYNWL